MDVPIWRMGEELHLVPGLATVWWISLVSPLGDSPHGLDLSLELPPGLRVVDPSHRPVFGVGPDRHRPELRLQGQRVELSFPGLLPAEGRRRPFSHADSWCDLHWPLVVIADQAAGDGAVLRARWRAIGDSASAEATVCLHPDPGLEPPQSARRMLELGFFPWFSQEEQEALALTLRRCGFTDLGLNWYDHGIPLLPQGAYALAARVLRAQIPGVKLWISGMPGADTIASRAQDRYGRPIPQVASPQALIAHSPDLLVASVRSWLHATEADGYCVTLHEPAARDTDFAPAHCFSLESRAAFAKEQELEEIPDALEILEHMPGAWSAFSCRQIRRVLELARIALGKRPLALCALGPGGTARQEASADWRELARVADILIYAHTHQAQMAPERLHWGHTRVGPTPQKWWERWNDSLGAVGDTALAVADLKMQLALSGGQGVRLWNWTLLDGQLQHDLMAWR